MLGMYWSEEETPSAPSRIAWSTRASMRLTSAGVAGRFSRPTTIARMPPEPTNVPRLMAVPAREPADSDDLAAAHAHVGGKPGSTGAVHDASAHKEEIVGGRLARGRSGRRRDQTQTRGEKQQCFHASSL